MIFRAFLISTLSAAAVSANGTDPAGLEFFEKNIRPVLIERCYECHSADAKVKGGLLLDTREGLIKGGDTGTAIVAGDPDKSLLVEAIRYKN
ncbi:MAG: c-type cytochrome domain-containing protein, partial [Verrucomicrobiota bacterium]